MSKIFGQPIRGRSRRYGLDRSALWNRPRARLQRGKVPGYADPSRGLDMVLRVHGLAAHAEDR